MHLVSGVYGTGHSVSHHSLCSCQSRGVIAIDGSCYKVAGITAQYQSRSIAEQQPEVPVACIWHFLHARHVVEVVQGWALAIVT